MKRNQYVITKSNGSELVAWANGYDISSSGVLSLGQLNEYKGQQYTALILSLNADEWHSIHQVENGRAKYHETGSIEKIGVVIQ